MKSVILLALLIFTSVGQANSPVILVIGDSLSAAYGIEQDAGWISLLQKRLLEQGYPHQVVNASISGDTTYGGLNRLPAAIERSTPSLVLIELGGNDGLRGFNFNQTRDNLSKMIGLSRASGSRVLLLGMMMPPNFGKAFTERFLGLYKDLAETEAVPLVPFFLDGVADRPELMQQDGLHPTAEGQPTMLDNVWPHLVPLL
ncbi:MAG: arylesterase [Candidatus Sedimenticola sp. PURPLELP]